MNSALADALVNLDHGAIRVALFFYGHSIHHPTSQVVALSVPRRISSTAQRSIFGQFLLAIHIEMKLVRIAAQLGR
jgi:hypothetical protein